MNIRGGQGRLKYEEIVARRRELHLPGYATLADVGFDGCWVTPYQVTSRSATGPVVLADNWLDVPSVRQHEDVLRRLGYLPGIKFNRVVDIALAMAGLSRPDIYVTQAFLLLPLKERSQKIPDGDVDVCFGAVTRHELEGRHVVALGRRAARACRRYDVSHVEVRHPSARTGTDLERATELAAALAR